MNRVHARRQFHGKPRYDMVQVSGDGAAEPWYARVLAFFEVHVGVGWRRMALVQWLERCALSHVPGSRTFRYWSQHPDAVLVSAIVRQVRMITSPRTYADTDDPCFVLLSYGKWGVR